MCGIAGFIKSKRKWFKSKTLMMMLKTLDHRGPILKIIGLKEMFLVTQGYQL